MRRGFLTRGVHVDGLCGMEAHVFTEGAGVSVALDTALETTEIWLLVHVDMHMFLAVRAVGESAIAAVVCTGKWFLP